MATQAAQRDRMSYDQHSPEASVYNERCMLQTPSPYTRASFFDDVGRFDAEDTGAMDTPPTSFMSSPSSTNSSGYHRGYNNPNETTWIKNSYSSWLASNTDESVSSSMVNCIHRHEWLDTESSSPVSMESDEQVLDALATRLAPARPQMIQLSNELQDLPALADSPGLNLHNRPGTPYEPSRRRMTLDNFALPSLNEEAIERSIAKNTIKIGIEHEVEISPGPIILGSKQECALSTAESFPDFDELWEHQHSQNGTVTDNSSKSIIDSIYNTLKGFPQHMLFLDTPCVVELRRQNHAASEASASKLPRTPSPIPSVNGKRFAKFFAQWLRGSPSKPSSYKGEVGSALATTLPAGSSSDSRVFLIIDPPHPDLAAFQRVFPTAQSWWRGVLYAQLVAYNYVRLIQVSSKQYQSGISPKASRTLGILEQHTTPFRTDRGWGARLDEVEMELVSCITWITNCMSGNRAVYMDQGSLLQASERDLVLVRSLAEIVNTSEEVLSKESKTSNVN